MTNALQDWAFARGYRVAWGPASIVDEAAAAITSDAATGALDSDFFREALEGELPAQEHLPGQTIVMVAKPRPAHRVTFDLAAVGGGTLEALLPPTYLGYRSTFEEVRRDLAQHGLPGARIEPLHGPHKAVAARLGLVKYGRNNLTYASGIGSYLQLCGYVTDAPLPAATTRKEPELLPECDSCQNCRKACPTRAIGEDRVLLRAQRCLTFANEAPGGWPDWVPKRKHRCLVGCLFCQRACPANPVLPVEDSGCGFSASETRALLKDSVGPPQDVRESLARKISGLGLSYPERTLGRNLVALLRSRSGSQRSS